MHAIVPCVCVPHLLQLIHLRVNELGGNGVDHPLLDVVQWHVQCLRDLVELQCHGREWGVGSICSAQCPVPGEERGGEVVGGRENTPTPTQYMHARARRGQEEDTQMVMTQPRLQLHAHRHARAQHTHKRTRAHAQLVGDCLRWEVVRREGTQISKL